STNASEAMSPWEIFADVFLALTGKAQHLILKSNTILKTDSSLPSIEDLSSNSLDNMKSLCEYLKQLYDFEIISVIAYEKMQDINASFNISKSWADYFDKLLVPGTLIGYEELNHGLVINLIGITPGIKSTIKLMMEPSYELIGSTKMLNISHIKTQKDLFDITNHINIFDNFRNLLDNIPFVTFVEDTIKPSAQFEAAIEKALEKENPYKDLETIFIEYGHVFCLKFVMEERLTKLNGLEQEIFKVPNDRFEDITSYHDIFKEWKDFLNEHHKDSSSFYLSGNSLINIDGINDIDQQLNTVTENPSYGKLSLYKLLKYDLKEKLKIAKIYTV
ncbi:26089_t:CDS:2, partial [Gigaspora margarita]